MEFKTIASNTTYAPQQRVVALNKLLQVIPDDFESLKVVDSKEMEPTIEFYSDLEKILHTIGSQCIRLEVHDENICQLLERNNEIVFPPNGIPLMLMCDKLLNKISNSSPKPKNNDIEKQNWHVHLENNETRCVVSPQINKNQQESWLHSSVSKAVKHWKEEKKEMSDDSNRTNKNISLLHVWADISPIMSGVHCWRIQLSSTITTEADLVQIEIGVCNDTSFDNGGNVLFAVENHEYGLRTVDVLLDCTQKNVCLKEIRKIDENMNMNVNKNQVTNQKQQENNRVQTLEDKTKPNNGWLPVVVVRSPSVGISIQIWSWPFQHYGIMKA